LYDLGRDAIRFVYSNESRIKLYLFVHDTSICTLSSKFILCIAIGCFPRRHWQGKMFWVKAKLYHRWGIKECHEHLITRSLSESLLYKESDASHDSICSAWLHNLL
jgi:hypothetical protein